MEYEMPEGYISPHGTLAGVDGNVFSVIGHVRRELREAGNPNGVIEEYTRRVRATQSYDEALTISMHFVGEFDAPDDQE